MAAKLITASALFTQRSVPYPFARRLIGVTGISRPAANLAEVEAIWHFHEDDGAHDPLAASKVAHIAKSTASMKLFDDGWRVEKISNSNGVDDSTKDEKDAELIRLGHILGALQASAPPVVSRDVPSPAAAGDSRAVADQMAARLMTAVNQETAPTRDAASVPEERGSSDPVIVGQCQQEWGTNFRMRMFCERQQEDAKAKLAARTAAGESIPYFEFDAIRGQCRREWPGNYRMQDFCETQQTKARRGLR
jgi:hypothetical protein